MSGANTTPGPTEAESLNGHAWRHHQDVVEAITPGGWWGHVGSSPGAHASSTAPRSEPAASGWAARGAEHRVAIGGSLARGWS
jgi:hypothetical protein